MGEYIHEYAPAVDNYKKVRIIRAMIECPLCKGKKKVRGEPCCYIDCGGRGQFETWVSIEDLKKSLRNTIA